MLTQLHHLIYGGLLQICSFSIFAIEVMRASHARTGYWVAVSIAIAGINGVVCGLYRKRKMLIYTLVTEILITILSGAGLSVCFNFIDNQGYSMRCVITLAIVVLLFHTATICSDLKLCSCLIRIDDINRERDERSCNSTVITPPPIDFVMPEKAPKLPNYEEVKQREKPPTYTMVEAGLITGINRTIQMTSLDGSGNNRAAREDCVHL